MWVPCRCLALRCAASGFLSPQLCHNSLCHCSGPICCNVYSKTCCCACRGKRCHKASAHKRESAAKP